MSILAPDDALDELTDEVVVTSSNSDVFHAPASGGGGAYCGAGHGHRTAIEHAPLRSRPCRHCFSEAAIAEYETGRYRENGSESSP